jgi:hypothetical protein
MFKRRLVALLAAISIAIGLAGVAHATEAEVGNSPPGIDCHRECIWT